MSLLAAIAAFLLTSFFSLGVSSALSEGFVPGGVPRQLPLDPVPSIDAPDRRDVETQRVQVPIRETMRQAVLTIPVSADDEADTAPGVVLVAGSGSADENSLQSEARAFAERGIAVLTYDKDEQGYSVISRDYGALGDDAAAAAQWLATRPGVDSRRVGLMGFSEGGWVAPLAASTHEGIAFVGMVSSPVVTPLENAAFTVDQALAKWPTPVRALPATVMSGGRWLCDYLDIDLRSRMEPLDAPVLAVFGADDPTVPLAEASARLQQIAPDSRVEIVPGAGHHVPVSAGEWVERASAWMHNPDVYPPGVTGGPSSQTVGLLEPPRKSWIQHPGLHLTLSAIVAVLIGTSVHRRRLNRRAHS